MSAQKDLSGVIESMATRRFGGRANTLSIAAMVLGVACFGYGLVGFGDHGAWAWGSFLVGVVYTMAIAQGGVMFAVVMTGTWGRWGRPLKRVAEAFGVFMPVAFVLLLVFLIGGLGIYNWNPATIIPGGPVALAPHSPEAVASKEVWLTPGFFVARQLFAVGVLIALNAIYLRSSLRPDLMMAKEALGTNAPSWWARVIGGKSDLKATLTTDLGTQSKLVPILALAYAVVFSLLAFDLLMSLSPWWFSNMFGGWFFMSSFWVSLAALGLVTMVTQDWLGIRAFVGTNVTHDLGKLMLAGCMFWAYTTFAQLLPIWYTDMPEETDYLLVRMYLPQWSWLAQLVAITCFLAPFTILLSRGIKKMRWPFAGICALIMCGIFFERTLLVAPQVHLGETAPSALMLMVSIGVWMGFLGLMVQVVGRFLATVPTLVVTDPYLEDHPWDVHVHSLDAAH